ncbi:putative disease resistance protein RGA4 [Vitis vinifera]|uniref:Putative disease resistance protein RGA4 n=1 Tax=Vitis vinifera TaxID=29760 RepID=A0A438IA01_VITVI|nr:putative disease resistance protein RGA4 [Vitis vinifera]
MAEQILFNIIADVLTKLGSSSIQQIGSAFGVAKELTKLTKKLTTIKGVLVDAEKRQEESDAVKAWVRRLKDVVYDADDLLDDFATHQLQRGGVARQVSDFFSSSNQLVFRFKMSSKVKNIKEEVDEIVKEINLLKLVQGNIVQREVESSWRETHSFVLTSEIVGREENKEEIIKSLVSSDNQEILSMVAIVGIGGLGKTTLAQLVYNDEKVVQYFEPRIWVCVSDHFDVKSLVKKFLKEVCEQDVEWLELNGLKNLLHKKISQKRCLLVLDDVWNENPEKWDQLKSLLMVVGKGSKILVTTRHTFAEEPEKVHPKLVEMGKEIVNMCNGVPLVIKTLGAMLRLKTEESHWLSIKNNRNLLSLGAGNDNVLSVLKLSYNDLPIYLKQCFTYCALFLKDYKIEKNMLVQLWMAQGYIQPLDENVGHQYFEELLSRSLLEKFRNDAFNNILSCKMHDLMHDLAQSVVESEVLILEDDVKEIPKEVRHVSLFNSMNLKLKALRAKHIRTFLSIPIHGYKDDSIPNIYFSSFKCLRVLSLNGFKVKEVPKSLEMPKDMRQLINLRHWEYDGYLSMPCGIGKLTLLQSLPLFVVGNERGVGRLSELKGLNNLKGKLRIQKLENVRDAVDESDKANLREKKYIRMLALGWENRSAQSGRDAEKLMEGLHPPPSLEELRIGRYGGMGFPSWMRNGVLSQLKSLQLVDLSEVEYLGCSSVIETMIYAAETNHDETSMEASQNHM